MPLETVIRRVKLRDLKLLEKNAHFMDPAEFSRLVSNIQKDGCLTSLPVVYQNEVLSGNHRTQAGIKAGIEESDIIEIISELTDDERIAIQLSHNSINGREDNNILKALYDSINSLDMKMYSGLTDDAFKIDEINVESLSFVQPAYEEMVIAFLPEEKMLFIEALEIIGKKAKSRLIISGKISDFDALFNAVIGAKSKLNIINTAEALKAVAELALQKMKELDDEQQDPLRQSES